MNIVAYISDGWHNSLLGRFASYEQAVRILCPPPSYYVLKNSAGRVTQENRTQRAGLCFNEAEAKSLLQARRVTFQRNNKLYTVSLLEDANVSDMADQPGIRQTIATVVPTAISQPRLGNGSGVAPHTPAPLHPRMLHPRLTK